MVRLTEQLVPKPAPMRAGVCGAGWKISVGTPGDPQNMVLLKREEMILAAMSPTQEGALRIATYQPLDAKSIEMVLDLARELQDGQISMRDTQWEYALDCSASMGQHYACARGEAYLLAPEDGAEAIVDLRHTSPRSAEELATELDTYEYFTRDIAVDYGA